MIAFSDGVHILFGVLCIITVASFVFTSSLHQLSRNADFVRFQYRYIGIFLVAMMADWLQGPYLYRLYEHYGFLEGQIAALYISGFISSMLFGPLLGNLADRYGRRRFCITFCYLYSLSCLMKISNNFYILMLGRILGGLSTSLLMSAFESWMIYHHNKMGFPEEWVSKTFALSTFGNGVVAVVAGLLANFAAELNGHHPLRPFLLAVCFLILCAYLIMMYWDIDDPDVLLHKNAPIAQSLETIFQSKRIVFLGIIQCTFEAAVYMFVFLWTPALDPQHVGGHPPLGVMFGSFMLAMMLGSCIFRSAMSKGIPVLKVLGQACTVACLSLAAVALAPNRTFRLFMFVLFEVCCGIVFPGLGTVRSEIIPEPRRASIINLYRVPLNLLVVIFLLLVGHVSFMLLFSLMAALCAVAVAVLRLLHNTIAMDMLTTEDHSMDVT
eukprot:gene5300-7072_t